MQFQVRQLTLADLPAAMELKQEAGWNQTVADWQRFLMMEPNGCFAAEHNGSLAGTVTTCCFAEVAWIGMMLVRECHRGLGLGKALFSAALDYLRERDVACVRLDATPLGRPLYERFEFRAQFDVSRMAGVPQILPVPSLSPELVAHQFTSANVSEVAELDRTMSKTDRQKLFDAYLRDGIKGELLFLRDELIASCLYRVGHSAVQIGPCTSSRHHVGEMALQRALALWNGQPVFVDIPCEAGDALNIARASGLQEQRRLFRMYLGQEIRENLDYLWSSSGPELG